MTPRCFALALFATLLFSGQAAHGFDCSKAVAPMDFVICSSPDVYAANEEMAETWRATRESLNEGGRATLVKSQRVWMDEVSSECGLPMRGKPKQEVVLAAQSCVARKIRERTPDIVQASNKFDFSQFPATIELHCSPETGEASIRVGSNEDTLPTALPLVCQLAPGHRLQIDQEETGLGAVLIRADDTLIGTVTYYGNHVMSLQDAYFLARIDLKAGTSRLIVDEIANGSNSTCSSYRRDDQESPEMGEHECDPSHMPPFQPQ